MYGQMTAGSWIYIGSQGIVQGTYETFAEMGRRISAAISPASGFDRGPRRHGRRAAAGRDHGGRQHAGGRMPPSRIEKRLETGYVDVAGATISTRRSRCIERARRAAQAGLGRRCSATSSTCSPEMLARGIRPDALTDQTSAHDPVNGYLPQGWTVEQWDERRASDPEGTSAAARARWPSTSSHAALQGAWACRYVDYGNNIRQVARDEGVARRVRHSGLRARLHPAAVLPRHRTVPLGRAVGRSGGHLQDRRQGQGADSRRSAPASLARHGALAHPIPGLAGAHLLGRARPAHRWGSPSTRWCERRAVGADRHRPRSPRLRLGGEPEPRDRSDADGSDAVSDWPLLNALLNTAAAPPGCRCITAAASAWATRSMPAW
jgi:urocanate hydratase